MKVKTIAGFITAIVALVIVILGGTTMGVVLLFLNIIGLYEFYHIFELKGHKPIKWVGLLYIPLIPFIFINNISEPLTIKIAGTKDINLFTFIQYVVMALLLVIIVVRHKKHNIIDAAITVMGGYYVVFLSSFFLLLRYKESGVFLFFIALVGTVSSDTAAQVFGVKWGKKKLIPEVSPKKTVIGSFGAFVGPLIFVVLYGYIINRLGYVNIKLYHFVILAILLGAGAQIGDLAASAMKRYANVKDFGKLIPGHGGVLDRIDSLLFCVPMVYYYLRFISI
ncbi:MAG TPA: phosphatidate cytidylyltransferase [Clostridiaceae bacterium]|jgi:phosphatidate cytidylyltransferase|nr:phosphatidate cytidylyltransferase [Clostridiaceae bacterium]